MRAAAVLLAMVVGSACAGLAARGDAMAVVASTFRNIVQPVVLVGIGAEQDAGNITAERAAELRGYVNVIGEVLEGGQVSEVGTARDAWNLLLPLAEAGIDERVARGEIGAGVGASIKEVLRLFGARLLQLETGGGGPAARQGITLTTTQWEAVRAVLR